MSYDVTKSRVIQWIIIILILIALGGVYFYFRSEAASTVTDDGRPSLEAPLTTSLDLTRGVGGPTFARADGADRRATVIDFEGLIRPVKNGEARFEGARRVENLNPKSEADSGWAAGGTTPPTVNTSVSYGGKTAVSVTLPTGVNGYSASRATGSTFPIKLNSQYIARYQIAADRALTGSESVTVYITGTAGMNVVTFSTSKQLTTGWVRYASSVSTNSVADGNDYFTVYPSANLSTPITIYLTERQVEEVTGQANQNPSEYVSTNVKTLAPYHGANVDGVKYFDTQNGNTVASNVVTEATGSAIATATLKGYLAETTRANLLTYSEQFDQWTQIGTAVTTTNTVVGPDGRTTAETLTDDNGAGYENISKTVTVANDSSAYTFSIYLKKDVATPAIFAVNYGISGGTPVSTNIRINTGTGQVVGGTATVTSFNADWWKVAFTVTNNSTGNTSLGTSIYPAARLVGGGGDTVTATGSSTIWGAQLEQATFSSSYIPTTTASVTRATDSLSYPSAGNFSHDAGSVYAEWQALFPPGIITAGIVEQLIYSHANGWFVSYDGTQNSGYCNPGYDLGGSYQVAARWSAAAGTGRAFKNGAACTSGIYDGNYASVGTALEIVKTSFSSVKNIRIFSRTLSDTELTNLTSATEARSNSAVQKSTNTAPDNTGLVGYWSFEDGSGTQATDFSGGGNAGTLAGAAGANNLPQWTDGKFGKALSFDGTDDKVSGGSFTVPATTTITGWIKKAASTGQKSFFSNRGTTGGAVYFGLSGTQVFFYNGGSVNIKSASNSVEIGQWQHVVAVSDGSSIKLYVNGALIHSASGTRTSSTGATFGIGWDPSIGTEYWDGSIDEVRVYDRVLSADEIASLYQSGIAKINVNQNSQNTSGLVGLWSFNGPDVSGTTAYDRSGSGNNGTLTGGPAVTEGKVGQALSFDGTDDLVNAGSASSLDNLKAGGGMTLSAWIKPRSMGATNRGRIFDKTNDASTLVDGWAFYFTDNVGNYQLTFAHNGGTVLRIRSVANVVTPNVWQHIGMTWDGSITATNVRIYVDGVEVGYELQSNGNILDSDSVSTLAIGNFSSGIRAFDGAIDEARIYNRALTDAEITALYNAGR